MHREELEQIVSQLGEATADLRVSIDHQHGHQLSAARIALESSGSIRLRALEHSRAVAVIATSSGNAAVSHSGRECRIGDRAATLLDLGRPTLIEVSRPAVLVLVAADMSQVLVHEPRVRGLLGHTLTGLTGTLASSAARALTDTDNEPSEIDDSQALSLIALSLKSESDRRPGGAMTRGDLYRRAMGFVDQQYADAGLRAVDVAEAVGVTVRDLEAAFNARGTSTHELLTKRRVLGARSSLSDVGTSWADAPLTMREQIADANGFFDPSHLERMLRSHAPATL